jgi:hypothetical protein
MIRHGYLSLPEGLIGMRTSLPSTPDFSALEAAAVPFADRQNQILAQIGTLGLAWSNNESVFVYILMILLETDEVSAAIVFSTLNTTRARIDLIRRLATVKIMDPAIAQTLTRIIRRFDACTNVRNELNHCVFTLNAQGEITHTQTMRVMEHKGSLSLGAVRPMDDRRLKEIREANKQLKRLNHDVWDFLPVLKRHIESRNGSAPRA